MHHVSILLLAGIVLLSGTLAGCGQKGPLTLPAKPVEATTPAPVATPASPAEAASKPAAEKSATDDAAPKAKDDKQVSPHVA